MTTVILVIEQWWSSMLSFVTCDIASGVNFVRNFTDVDDKIIVRAMAEGIDPLDYAQRCVLSMKTHMVLV